GHDRLRISVGLGQLGNVSLGGLLLVLVGVKNHGAILLAFIGTLPIEFRWIVRNREENLKQVFVRHLRRVVDHLDRLGMSRHPGADDRVTRGGSATARVTRGDLDDAFYVLENRVNAPETSTRKDCNLVLLVGAGGRFRATLRYQEGCSKKQQQSKQCYIPNVHRRFFPSSIR